MNPVFDVYARCYDLLYQDKDYSAEVEYVSSHIRQRLPDASQILELGCGTGAHAQHLASLGYSVHGIDLSQRMLSEAETRKTRLSDELAARLSFSHGDLRTVQQGKIYDAVIMLFHVMSYQTTNADVASAFRTAAVHLKKGGLFLFDFWYGPAVLNQKTQVRIKRLEDDMIKVTRIAEPEMYVNENIVDVNYTVFIEDKKSGLFQQFKETHRMRYFFLPELEIYQKQAFENCTTYSWMTDKQVDMDSWAGVSLLDKI